MKVLIVYHAGAMENARRIYQALVQTGVIELTVIVPQRLKVDQVYAPTGWLCAQREGDDGYRLIPVPLRDPLNYGQGFESEPLGQVIKQIRPQIIHVVDEATSGYLFQVVWQRLIASPRSKVLFYGFDNLLIRHSWKSYLAWKLTWVQMAGGVTANSEALEILKRAGFPLGLPLRRIFWGIPTDVFKPMDQVALRKRLGLDCIHIVGFVGRLVREKGLGWLLAAFKRLPSQVHCLIIGSGPMREEVKCWSEHVDLVGRVHLYDARRYEEMPTYLNCMDVLAVPSLTTQHWKEQYGRVIAEAMACGVPVVGSDSGAIPEVMGSAGLIVPEGNVSALMEALQTAIFDKERRAYLTNEGLRRVDQELSVRAMSRRLWSFYSRILAT